MLKIFRAAALAMVALAVWSPALQADQKPAAVPMVTMAREGFENSVWLYDRVKMGKEFVQGTIQGLGGATDALIIYKLDKKYDAFEATVGYVETAPDGKSAVFEVWCDGVMVYATESIRSEEQPDVIRVPVKGANFMQLRIRPDRYDGTHGAAWGQPMLYSGVGPDFIGTLKINRNGERETILTSKMKSTKEIDVPVPLKEGTYEYTVKVVYDKKNGTVDIETTDLTAPAAVTTPTP